MSVWQLTLAVDILFSLLIDFKVRFVGVLAKLASAMDSKLRVMKAMQGWKFESLVEVLRCRMVRIVQYP